MTIIPDLDSNVVFDPAGEWTSHKLEDTFQLGKRLGEHLAGGEIILLDGALGAGKTVFAKGLGSGVREFKKGTSGQYENDEVKDRKEDKELPRSEPSASVRAEDVNTRAAHAEQKR